MSKPEIIQPFVKIFKHIVSKASEQNIPIPETSNGSLQNIFTPLSVLEINQSNVRVITVAYMIACNSQLYLGPYQGSSGFQDSARMLTSTLHDIMESMLNSRSDEISAEDLQQFVARSTSFLTDSNKWMSETALAAYIDMYCKHARITYEIENLPSDAPASAIWHEELARLAGHMIKYETSFQQVHTLKVAIDSTPQLVSYFLMRSLATSYDPGLPRLV